MPGKNSYTLKESIKWILYIEKPNYRLGKKMDTTKFITMAKIKYFGL